MKAAINYLASASLFGALLFASNVRACAPEEDSSLCSRIGEFDTVVFIGKTGATRERESTSKDYTLAPSTLPFAFTIREIDFEVQEAFNGIKEQSKVTLYSTARNCAYQFIPGKTYLVYAFVGPQDKINAMSCTAIRPISETSAKISLLRDSIRRSSGTVVQGRIIRNTALTTNNTSFGIKPKIAGISVLLKPISGKGRIQQTKSDSEGKYEIDGVPTGHYVLELGLPGKLTIVDGTIIGVDTSGIGCVIRNIMIEGFAPKVLNFRFLQLKSSFFENSDDEIKDLAICCT